MQNLKINLKNQMDDSYKIIFTSEVGKELSTYLLSTEGFSPLQNKILIVSDSNIFPLHYYNLFASISTDIEVFNHIIEAGEENKNIEAVLEINKKLIEHNFNRGDILVALGGGVVGDIVGFSASIFKRGIDFIQIPTTLLSMFDSSVGGKTGVDFEGIKNIIGAFKQPKLVLINSEYLETLPQIEILSGYFEGLKHSLIKSEKYFNDFMIKGELFFKEDLSDLENIIKENISVKAEIVMEDEKEMGVRKFLNLGHTFGHALESVTNFKLTHGVGVAYGIIFVNILSNKLGYLSNENLNKINNFIISILNQQGGFSPLINNINFESIYEKMLNDKKNNSKKISFVLLKKPGELFIEKIGEDRKNVLEKCFKEFLEKIN